MEGTGLKCDKVIGTEIYEVSGEKNGLIYLKVRSRGKPFFGIRHEFSKILLGDAPGNITEVEKKYLMFLLSDEFNSGENPPKDWKLRQTTLRHLAIMVKHCQPWACVLLLGRDDRWVCDGWVLTSSNVSDGLRRWSFSASQGEYKINEPDLRNLKKHLGLQAVSSAVVHAL
jgi:hypothetical protein